MESLAKPPGCMATAGSGPGREHGDYLQSFRGQQVFLYPKPRKITTTTTTPGQGWGEDRDRSEEGLHGGSVGRTLPGREAGSGLARMMIPVGSGSRTWAGGDGQWSGPECQSPLEEESGVDWIYTN